MAANLKYQRRLTRRHKQAAQLSVLLLLQGGQSGATELFKPAPITQRLDFYGKAIPLMKDAPTSLDYHQIPIDFKVEQAKETLVDPTMLNIAAESFYARDDKHNAPYYRKFESAPAKVLVRESVARKLAEANTLLKPYGVELLLLDGYRPVELQRELWDHFIKQAKTNLKNLTEEECVQFAGLFCSDPSKFKEDDWRTWPTHNTGGAIDLTLREIASGRELYMGGVFDDASEISYTDYYELHTGPDNSSSFAEAKRNRRLLYWAMTSVGFANYPYEWWHFDYGTQMWVMNSGRSCCAHYGRAGK